MKRYTVVGGGFGLYGHCQCILDHDLGQLVLWDAYRPRFLARPELAGHADRVAFRPDLDSALAEATHAVIAVPPSEQAAVLERLIAQPGLGAIGLEKPLAADPATALRSLERLRGWGGRWSVDYSFLHARWLPGLRGRIAGATGAVHLRWHFLAHHHRNRVATWKRVVANGGGALRFFGVHLIALANSLGYDCVHASETRAETDGEADAWSAVLAGAGLPDLHLAVDTRAPVPQFQVTDSRGELMALADPFDAEEIVAHGDRRCPVLLRFLRSLDASESIHAEGPELAVVRLWAAVEVINHHRTVAAA